MYPASSESRKTARELTSDGLPARLMGMVCMIISMGASFIMSVSINPGAMQFTVIERLASSVARAFVAPMIPALDAL